MKGALPMKLPPLGLIALVCATAAHAAELPLAYLGSWTNDDMGDVEITGIYRSAHLSRTGLQLRYPIGAAKGRGRQRQSWAGLRRRDDLRWRRRKRTATIARPA